MDYRARNDPATSRRTRGRSVPVAAAHQRTRPRTTNGKRTNHSDATRNDTNGNTHPTPPAKRNTDKQHSDHRTGIRRSANSEKPPKAVFRQKGRHPRPKLIFLNRGWYCSHAGREPSEARSASTSNQQDALAVEVAQVSHRPAQRASSEFCHSRPSFWHLCKTNPTLIFFREVGPLHSMTFHASLTTSPSQRRMPS